MIAESRKGLQEEFHPNVRIPTYNVRFNPRAREVEIHFDISLYTGGVYSEGSGEGQYIFYYMYVPPAEGVNVDILDFQIKFNANLTTWMSATLNSVSYHSGIDGESVSANRPTSSQNVVHENTIRYKNQNITPTPRVLFDKINDVTVFPASPRKEDAGYVAQTHEGAPAARLAFQTLAEAHSPVGNNGIMNMTIRGHLDLLYDVVPRPDRQSVQPGVNECIWIKVDVRDYEQRPFYYTGWYRLQRVENTFNDGKFEQVLEIVLEDRVK